MTVATIPAVVYPALYLVWKGRGLAPAAPEDAV
jgi:hypothetical protein